MPLAGEYPTRKAKQFDREEAEDRAFRMLSEGTKSFRPCINLLKTGLGACTEERVWTVAGDGR